MAQHDYVIDNQSFPNFRADLNQALQALVTQNAGATPPTAPHPHQVWADTTDNLLKQRNADNTAWLTLGPLDGMHASMTLSGRSAVGDGPLQDLTIEQVKVLLGINPAGLLSTLHGVDGHNSALDADLLDGHHALFFQNANNTIDGVFSLDRLPVGTGPNRLIVTDNNSRLPAVDGSRLTGLPGTDHQTVTGIMHNKIGGGSFRSGGAIMRDGSLRFWGNALNGQAGMGSAQVHNTPGPDALPFPQSHTAKATKWVASGYNHWVLFDDGSVWSWGENSSGELGHGTTSHTYLPTKIEGDLVGQHVTDIATGVSNRNDFPHILFLTQEGKIFSCGSNGRGQLGVGNTDDRHEPTRVGAASNWTHIYAFGSGSGFSAALNTSGHLYMWGDNQSGQLGDGSTAQTTVPYFVNRFGSSRVVQFSATQNKTVSDSASESFCAARLDDGRIFTWGNNHSGQLGDGTTVQKTVPVEIGTMGGNNRYVHCAGGRNGSTYVVHADGNIWSTGYNGHGQLARNGTSNSLIFGEIHDSAKSGVVEIIHVGQGPTTTMFVRYSNGSVWGCGYNGASQLGNGGSSDISDTLIEIKVKGPSRIVDICAIGNGQVLAGGNQLGLGMLNEEGQYFQTGPGRDHQNGDPNGNDYAVPRHLIF